MLHTLSSISMILTIHTLVKKKTYKNKEDYKL